jgi:hypothetical protein
MNETVRNGEVKSSNDVERAKVEVAQAEAALSKRLHEATVVGEATMKRAFALARPVLVGAAVLGGVIWIASMIRRSSRHGGGRAVSAERSVVSEVLRAAALSLASVTARRLGERFLTAPDATQSISAGRVASPQVPSHTR